MVLAWLLVPITAWAAIGDWRVRRIPNFLPLAILVGGLLIMLLRSSSDTTWAVCIAMSAGGASLGALVTLPGYLLGVMGAGDVKLLAALGWALAWPGALILVLVWALAFALWCLVAVLLGGRRRQPVAPSMLIGHASALAMGLS